MTIEQTEIRLPFPPSANTLFTNRRGGRAKTDRYSSWIVEAGTELMIQRPHKFLTPVNLDIRLDVPDRRIRDVTNYVKATEDLLVRHGVIQGDDTRYVRNVSVGLPEFDETIPVIVLRMA